jgi:hypothetical protein
LAVQWLRLSASTAGSTGSIPGPGIKILHTAPCSKKKEKNMDRKTKIRRTKTRKQIHAAYKTKAKQTPATKKIVL